METDSFIVYIKTEDIYKYIDIANTLHYELDRPLPKEK